MPIAVLCDDVLRDIIALTVNTCHRATDFQISEVHPCPLEPSVPAALVTLIRLSQVDFRWRSLALLSCSLWASNLHITRNMSAALLAEVLIRTGQQSIHLRAFDLPPEHPLWPQVPQLFQRCVTVCCHFTHYPHCINVFMTTPAPLLEHCVIFCEEPSQIVGLWKPFFGGLAPSLRCLCLTRTPGNDLEESWAPHLLVLSTIATSLGRMEQLTRLEFNFPTNTFQNMSSPPFPDPTIPVTLPHVEELKISGNPFTLGYLFQAIELPAVNTISAVYAFSPGSVLQAMAMIWGPVFRHFPSVDFPTFSIHSDGNDYNFLIHHSNGQRLRIRFEVRGIQLGMDGESTRPLLPFIHIPPAHISQSQVLHGVAWMRLVSVPKFAMSVRTVTVSSSSPNSAFPFHIHFLLSTMVGANTLRFHDCASAGHPAWYDLLRDTTGLFGHPPLPNISTICLPGSSLGRVLSNVGLRDLVWDRRETSPFNRLHFIESANPEEPTTLSVLKEVSDELPVLISFETNE